jgi:hypothetical protein
MFDTAPHPIGHRYKFRCHAPGDVEYEQRTGIEVTVVNFAHPTEYSAPTWTVEGPGGWTGYAFEDELTFIS